MDLFKQLTSAEYEPIHCVETHTSGEPTRIVVKGYPALKGSTLLEQRADAKANHDDLRKRLLLESRGHSDMYGAIIRQHTELTESGEADIGVLFATNDGYSTMCGHATIALGRFLLDTHDLGVFPRRDAVRIDTRLGTAEVRLYAHCGLVEVTVPTSEDGRRSDPTRPVSHKSVTSFATGIDIEVPLLSSQYRWVELGDRQSVTADFAYGGAFYCIVSAKELGFANGLTAPNFDAFNKATKPLKAAVNANSQLKKIFTHPDHEDLGFLYSVIVVDATLEKAATGSLGAETGLCYFADQQVDRSPTGSAVAARCALAYAKGQRALNERWTYHSHVSNAFETGGFVGAVCEVEQNAGSHPYPHVRVKIEGYASYTGFHTFVRESTDGLGEGGFVLDKL